MNCAMTCGAFYALYYKVFSLKLLNVGAKRCLVCKIYRGLLHDK